MHTVAELINYFTRQLNPQHIEDYPIKRLKTLQHRKRVLNMGKLVEISMDFVNINLDGKTKEKSYRTKC